MSDESKGSGITNLLEGLLRTLEHNKFSMLAAIVALSGIIFLSLPPSVSDFLNISPLVARYRGIISSVTIIAMVSLVIYVAFRVPRAISRRRWEGKLERQRQYEDTLASLELPDRHHERRVIQQCLYTKQRKVHLPRESRTAFWLESKGFLKRSRIPFSSTFKIPTCVWNRLREDETRLIPQIQPVLDRIRRDVESFDPHYVP
jgi:hypothetical protein